MNTFFIAKNVVGIFGLVALAFFALFLLPTTEARSQANSEVLGGYAWSETIGWVALSGSGHTVVREANGYLAGYAWSENIGWISANPADTAVCGPQQARIQNNSASGWLRAIAGGAAQSGGWDGCISLSGTGYGVTLAPNPSFSTNFAWGGEVVGWLSFDIEPLTPPAPPPSFSETPLPLDISLTAEPGRVQKGKTATIRWSSQNAESCTVTGPGGPWTGLSGVETTPDIQAQTVYALECSNAGGSASRLITVTVIPSVQEI